MTKAERLFDKNYRLCRKHIKAWGFEGIGFSGIECEDNETVSIRTCNDIQKLIDKERKSIERKIKLGIEGIELQQNAIEMLQLTLDNQRKHDKEFKDMMKEI